MLQMWLGGLQGLMHVDVLLFVVLGMAIGLVFGAIPGLGGTTAIALDVWLLPSFASNTVPLRSATAPMK